MTAYITFDRYEHNEWFALYHIDDDYDSAVKHCKEVDLVDFISYGPDDCHSFQLVAVEMNKAEYKKLCKIRELAEMNSGAAGYDKKKTEEAADKLDEFLEAIYEGDGYETENIIFTDGCSDLYDIARCYAENMKKEASEEDDDSDLYEVVCPECEETFYIDNGIYQEGICECPTCGEELEFEDDEDGIDEDEAMDILMADDELFEKVLREYIENTY